MFSILPSNSDFMVDTHAVLMELDRSLGSSSIGEQCEGIVKIPSLFHRYPFPILINAASLKLSEVYQNGNDFLRILILQVVKESEKHLDKILNIEEFVRHLFAVSYSNDPLARSITLQTLGHIARIVSDNKNIHHLIRNSLESNDELEVNAAIEASVKFAIQSKDFAQNIYPKVIYMIEGLQTPMNIKIRLLEVINNLHHNFAIVEDARQKLISFLGKYPEKNFVCENLRTLTSISLSSITHLPAQVDLLLNHYSKDPRITVQICVLDNLKNLAQGSSHLWQKRSIDALIKLILVNPDADRESSPLMFGNLSKKELLILCKSLSILNELVSSPSIFVDETSLSTEQINKIVDFSTSIIYQSTCCKLSEEQLQISTVSICFKILTNICLHMNPRLDQELRTLQETCCAYEIYFSSLYTTKFENKESLEALKVIFHSMVTLCRTKESDPRRILPITEALRFLLLESKPNRSWYEMICESVCSLAPVIHLNQSLTAEDLMNIITKSPSVSVPKNDRVTIKLLIIYFQLKTKNIISGKECRLLLKTVSKYNAWICYKIARAAMRFGHHDFATKLLEKIKPSTESIESSYFWINSLIKITEAESCFIQDDFNKSKNQHDSLMELNSKSFEPSLMTSISKYTQGLIHLKASISNMKPMHFKCEYIKLRLKYLQAHQHFRQCCQILKTSPTPVQSTPATTAGGVGGTTVSNQPTTTTDDFQRSGRIAMALQKCSQEFRTIADDYSALYQSSFDADPNTLSNIQLLQHGCTILAEVIENLFQKSHRIKSMFVPSRMDLVDGEAVVDRTANQVACHGSENRPFTIMEHKELEDVCSWISDLVKNGHLMSLNNMDFKQPSSAKNLAKFFAQQIDMLLSVSSRMLLVPLTFPRFFFQTIQSTNIKLELSSKEKSTQEICFGLSTQFVLYVEGVISNQSTLDMSFSKSIAGVSPKRLISNYRSSMTTISGTKSAPSMMMMKKRSSSSSSAADSDRKQFRKVEKILLTLTAPLLNSNDQMFNYSQQQQQSTITMNALVQPLNDYFHTQFLLSFSQAGTYNIVVETSIIDEKEAQWKCGPIQSIVAKVLEDQMK